MCLPLNILCLREESDQTNITPIGTISIGTSLYRDRKGHLAESELNQKPNLLYPLSIANGSATSTNIQTHCEFMCLPNLNAAASIRSYFQLTRK